MLAVFVFSALAASSAFAEETLLGSNKESGEIIDDELIELRLTSGELLSISSAS